MRESKLSKGAKIIPRFLTTGEELISTPSVLRQKVEELNGDALGEMSKKYRAQMQTRLIHDHNQGNMKGSKPGSVLRTTQGTREQRNKAQN